VTSAQAQWREQLAGWAIPDDILASAPEPPWGFPVELFRAEVERADTPSRDVAREALPAGGSVLDVGCGGGAASFALVPPAARLVGVDSTPEMVEEYAAAATRRGVAHAEVEGPWPDVAPAAGRVDVVVCHHVFYNVPALGPFVNALSDAAERRVVVEMTASHPLTASAPLWRHFHGVERPAGPTAELAVEALREVGVVPQVRAWSRPPRDVPREAYVRLNRRRLCLPVEAEPEVERLMADPATTHRDVVTIWWDIG
jgi:SAM-dependent methyltransferase